MKSISTNHSVAGIMASFGWFPTMWSIKLRPTFGLKRRKQTICGCDLELVIFKVISRIDNLSIPCGNAIRWMPKNLTNDWLTLVQVMTWHCQATSHYLKKCWPRSMLPYDIIRPQWVKISVKIWRGTSRRVQRKSSCSGLNSSVIAICTVQMTPLKEHNKILAISTPNQ